MAKLVTTSCVICDESVQVPLDQGYTSSTRRHKLSQVESQALCKILRLPSFPFDFQFLQALFCKDCKTYIKKSSVIFDQIESLNLHLTQIRSIMQNKLAKFATVLHSHTSVPTNLEEVNISDKPVNDTSFRWEIRKQVFQSLQHLSRKEANLDFDGERTLSQGISVRSQKGHLSDCLLKTEKEIITLSPQSVNSELSQHDNHPSPDDRESDLSSQQECGVVKANAFEESLHLSPQVVEHQEPASNSETVNLQSVESNDVDTSEARYDSGSQRSPDNSDTDNIQILITESQDEDTSERVHLNPSSTASNPEEDSEKYGQSTPNCTEERGGISSIESTSNVDKHCQTEESVDKLEYELQDYENTSSTPEPIQPVRLPRAEQDNLKSVESELPNTHKENNTSSETEEDQSDKNIASPDSNPVQPYVEEDNFRKQINIQCSLDFSALTEADNESGSSVTSILIPGIDFSSMNGNTNEPGCNVQPSGMLTEMSYGTPEVRATIANDSIIFSSPSVISNLSGNEATTSLSKISLPQIAITSVNEVNAIPDELDFSSFPGTDDMSTTTVEVSTTGLPELHFSQINVANNSSLMNLQSHDIDICSLSAPTIITISPNTGHVQMTTEDVSSSTEIPQFMDRDDTSIRSIDSSKGMPELIPVSPVESGSTSSESELEPPRLLKERLAEIPKRLTEVGLQPESPETHSTFAERDFLSAQSCGTTQNLNENNLVFPNFASEQLKSPAFFSPSVSNIVSRPESSSLLKKGIPKFPGMRFPMTFMRAGKPFAPYGVPFSPAKEYIGQQPKFLKGDSLPPLIEVETPAAVSHNSVVPSLPTQLKEQPVKLPKENETSFSLPVHEKEQTHAVSVELSSEKEPASPIQASSSSLKEVSSEENSKDAKLRLPDLSLPGALQTSLEPLPEMSLELALTDLSSKSNTQGDTSDTTPPVSPSDKQEADQSTSNDISESSIPEPVDANSVVAVKSTPTVQASNDSDDEISIVAEYCYNTARPRYYRKSLIVQRSRLKALSLPNSKGYQIVQHTSRKKPSTVFNVGMETLPNKSAEGILVAKPKKKDSHSKRKESYDSDNKSVHLKEKKKCKERDAQPKLGKPQRIYKDKGKEVNEYRRSYKKRDTPSKALSRQSVEEKNEEPKEPPAPLSRERNSGDTQENNVEKEKPEEPSKTLTEAAAEPEKDSLIRREKVIAKPNKESPKTQTEKDVAPKRQSLKKPPETNVISTRGPRKSYKEKESNAKPRKSLKEESRRSTREREPKIPSEKHLGEQNSEPKVESRRSHGRKYASRSSDNKRNIESNSNAVLKEQKDVTDVSLSESFSSRLASPSVLQETEIREPLSPDISDAPNFPSKPKRVAAIKNAKSNKPASKRKLPVKNTKKRSTKSRKQGVTSHEASVDVGSSEVNISTVCQSSINMSTYRSASASGVDCTLSVSEKTLTIDLERLCAIKLRSPEGALIDGTLVKINPSCLYLLNRIDSTCSIQDSTSGNDIPGTLAEEIHVSENVSEIAPTADAAIDANHEPVESIMSECPTGSCSSSSSFRTDNTEKVNSEQNQLKVKVKSYKKSQKKMAMPVDRHMPISERQQIKKLLQPVLSPPELSTNRLGNNSTLPTADSPDLSANSKKPQKPIKIKISKKRLADGTEAVEVSTPKKSALEASTPKKSPVEASTPKTSPVEASTPKKSPVEASTPKKSPVEVSAPKKSAVEVSATKKSAVEVNPPKKSAVEGIQECTTGKVIGRRSSNDEISRLTKNPMEVTLTIKEVGQTSSGRKVFKKGYD